MTGFGDRLRELRLRKGLKQRELAAKLDIESMQISRWERGVVPRSGEQLARLADALDTTVDYLLRGHVPERVEPVRDDLPLTDEGRPIALQQFLDSLDPDDPRRPDEEELRWLEGLSFRELRDAGLEVVPSLYDRLLRERRAQLAGKLHEAEPLSPPPRRPGRVPLKRRR